MKGKNHMLGAKVAPGKAMELAKRFGLEVYVNPQWGCFVRTDNVDDWIYTYNIYRTGGRKQPIPRDSFRV